MRATFAHLDTNGRDVTDRRSSEWRDRAEEIKARDNYKCRRCGAPEGREQLLVHHIVPGALLTKMNARAEVNLVTLCRPCHGVMEGMHPTKQYIECGWDTPVRAIQTAEGGCTYSDFEREVGLGEPRLESLIIGLEVNCVLVKTGETTYRTPKGPFAFAAYKQKRHEARMNDTPNVAFANIRARKDEIENALEDVVEAYDNQDSKGLDRAVARAKEVVDA